MEECFFEMPTPCEHCGKIFDLTDGRRSEKWYPNIVICEECAEEEEREIEEDDRWEEINIEVSNALYELKEEGAWAKLTDENRALIIQLVSNSLLSSENIKKWHAILTGKGEKEMYDSIKSNDC
jgi:hypothetical protein